METQGARTGGVRTARFPAAGARRGATPAGAAMRAADRPRRECRLQLIKERKMGKAQDSKKEAKKEPAKTAKEKKADKKVKQEEKKRQ
jgi:hypothetical protein